MPGAKPQNPPPSAAASRRAPQDPGEEQVPGERGAGQVERRQQRERDRRAEQQGDRREQHAERDDRGVGHQVDPVGRVESVGDQREVAEQDPRVDGQEPLVQGLVLRVERQRPAGRVGPQAVGEPPREHREVGDEQIARAGRAAAGPGGPGPAECRPARRRACRGRPRGPWGLRWSRLDPSMPRRRGSRVAADPLR